MAFTKKSLEMIAAIPKLRKVVSFGYPIILMHPDLVQNLFKIDLDRSDMMSNTYAQRVRKVHGTSQQYFVSTELLFKKLGASFYCIDIVSPYNQEIIHDLNNDFPEHLIRMLDNADLCIDPGTLEHVFHAGKAFVSLYNLCKLDGYVLHVSAPIVPNHGLWNPQEKLFLRFYTANKAKIILAEKWWVEDGIPHPFMGKRWKLNRASELRSTVFVKKTNDDKVVLPKDYLT